METSYSHFIGKDKLLVLDQSDPRGLECEILAVDDRGVHYSHVAYIPVDFGLEKEKVASFSPWHGIQSITTRIVD